MSKAKILLVEDNEMLSASIAEYLEMEGYIVTVEANGIIAQQRILNEQPDLVILDLMLPGRDGVSICRQVRDQFDGFILMFTAKEDEIDQIIGLEIGADDYLVKPVKPRLLLAKINSFLRRKDLVIEQDDEMVRHGQLCIDKQRRQVTYKGLTIDITAAEYEALLLLAQHSGEILSREFMAQHLKGLEYDGLERSTDNRISQLRKKLNDNARSPEKIKTIRSKGYLFVASAWG
ncbi:Response regulator receiver:Transcriptional regulatory protein, C-terminal [Marinomonas sp. MED121]|uniref:response regulator n=1 Tax=Marinomonas sp. MED121 TaxID=314277 RepID=UPI000068FE41|nr:response regulator [Marinomonas sp. MED121]EAQ63409.1 Response regulator receiver:Transcriptional regulatory protein, C-terminal [Marinomonas sp. MED121]